MVPGLANLSYEERLEAMDLPSLHTEGPKAEGGCNRGV